MLPHKVLSLLFVMAVAIGVIMSSGCQSNPYLPPPVEYAPETEPTPSS